MQHSPDTDSATPICGRVRPFLLAHRIIEWSNGFSCPRSPEQHLSFQEYVYQDIMAGNGTTDETSAGGGEYHSPHGDHLGSPSRSGSERPPRPLALAGTESGSTALGRARPDPRQRPGVSPLRSIPAAAGGRVQRPTPTAPALAPETGAGFGHWSLPRLHNIRQEGRTLPSWVRWLGAAGFPVTYF